MDNVDVVSPQSSAWSFRLEEYTPPTEDVVQESGKSQASESDVSQSESTDTQSESQPDDAPQQVSSDRPTTPSSLPPIEQLNNEELERVYSKLPESMRAKVEEQETFEFKTPDSDLKRPSSVKCKIFPQPKESPSDRVYKERMAEIEKTEAEKRRLEQERLLQEGAISEKEFKKAVKKQEQAEAKIEKARILFNHLIIF